MVAVCTIAGLAPLRAADTAPGAPSSSGDNAGKLSEKLIYSVDRTPEDVFDTARGVQVITREEITRANVQTLGQLLERQPSFAVVYTLNGSMPIVRGLAGKQVLFLIDGAKVTNATWRGGTKEYLNIIDLNQVERIEIVRGVVSVLGTESLGAVVNIITRKNGPAGDGFGGTITSRYSSADQGVYVPIDFYGSTGSLRYSGGVSYANTDDIRGGGDVGKQPSTSYGQQAAHLNGQWLLSPEKTLEIGTQVARARVEGPLNATLREIAWDPAEMQFGRLSYQDLTSRGWEESLKLTVFADRQKEFKNIMVVNATGTTRQAQRDVDTLAGANLELGSFLGRHHLVYGLDYTSERVSSHTRATDAAGRVTDGRGNFMDGSSYQTLSAYIQDRFDVGQRVTLIGGLRGGRFEKSGDEKNNVGTFNIDDRRSNVTGALNAIVRVTPTLNVIANAVKGYRVPNLDDVSHFLTRSGTVEVPNPQAIPEKVFSTEVGLKYSNSALSGSLIWFKNDFKDLLVRTNGTYLGLPFRDTNGNGKRDAGEATILQNLNVGEATITGVEADFSLALRRGFSLYGSYSRLRGDDTANHQPLPAMPPAFGALGVRYASTGARPWGELEYRFAGAQTRLNPVDLTDPVVAAKGVPAYRTLSVRTGMMLTPRFGTSLAVENIFDEAYRFNGSLSYAPGRQVVLGTQFHF